MQNEQMTPFYYNSLLVLAILNGETAMCNVLCKALQTYQELSQSPTLYLKSTNSCAFFLVKQRSTLNHTDQDYLPDK